MPSAFAFDYTADKVGSDPVWTMQVSDGDFQKKYPEEGANKKQISAGAGSLVWEVLRDAVKSGNFSHSVDLPGLVNGGLSSRNGFIQGDIKILFKAKGYRIPREGEWFQVGDKRFCAYVLATFQKNGVWIVGCYNTLIDLQVIPLEPNSPPVVPPTEPNSPPYKEKVVEKYYEKYKETVIQQTIVAGNCSASSVGTIHHIQPMYQPGLVLTSVFGSLFWYDPIKCENSQNPNDPNSGCGPVPPGIADPNGGGPPDINNIPDGIINNPEPVGTISTPIPVNPSGTTPVIQPTGPVDIPSGILKTRIVSGQK